MPSQLITALPIIIMWIFIGIGYLAKLLLDRQRYAKQADNHVLIQKLPSVGDVEFELTPIEEIGGQSCVRYPRKGDVGKWPIHYLSDTSRKPVRYPINKGHFVQTKIDLLVFLGDDSEPLSNISGIPIVSAQQLGAMIQGVTLATDEALRNVRAESGEKLKQGHGLLWVYICMGILAIIGVSTIVIVMSQSGIMSKIIEGLSKLMSAAGLQ